MTRVTVLKSSSIIALICILISGCMRYAISGDLALQQEEKMIELFASIYRSGNLVGNDSAVTFIGTNSVSTSRSGPLLLGDLRAGGRCETTKNSLTATMYS